MPLNVIFNACTYLLCELQRVFCANLGFLDHGSYRLKCLRCCACYCRFLMFVRRLDEAEEWVQYFDLVNMKRA